MRILLDNCLPFNCKPAFRDHDARHDLDPGWDTLSNGRLLEAAAREGFQVLVTVDKNMRFQQNLDALGLSILVLDLLRTRRHDILAIAPYFNAALDAAASHRLVILRHDGVIESLSARRGPRP